MYHFHKNSNTIKKSLKKDKANQHEQVLAHMLKSELQNNMNSITFMFQKCLQHTQILIHITL